MIQKPSHGSPCNGCGACCRQELCPLGAGIFRTWEGPCPALIPEGAHFACGLIRNPQEYAPVRAAMHGTESLREAARYLVGAGVGCDTLGDGETPNLDLRRAFARHNRGRVATSAALKLWGVAFIA